MIAGKSLTDLAHEIDVEHKSVKTLTDDRACISWQDDGTLTYFSHYDGYPSCYYAPWTDFANNKEDFTSLAGLMRFMKNGIEKDNEYVHYLLTAPVWCILETPNKARHVGQSEGQEAQVTNMLDLQVTQALKRLKQGEPIEEVVKKLPEGTREGMRAGIAFNLIARMIKQTQRMNKLTPKQAEELETFLNEVTIEHIASVDLNMNVDLSGLNNELPPEEDDYTAEDVWEISTAKKDLKFQMHDDTQMLVTLIKRIVSTHQYLASPYPVWQYADAISKSLAEIDWQSELTEGGNNASF